MTSDPNEFVILGAGGHARVVLAALKATGITVSGCVAPECPGTLWPSSVQWLGDDTALQELDPTKVQLVNGVGSTTASKKRTAPFNRARAVGFEFATIKHPSAFIDETVELGQGAQIMAGAVLQAGATIGQNTIVNTGAIVDHDCQIGDHVHIAPGSCLSGSVTIKNGVHVGAGATVIQNIIVGADTTIGAGAVIIRDIKANRVVYGIPAREQQS